jgi:hypothetical protein
VVGVWYLEVEAVKVKIWKDIGDEFDWLHAKFWGLRQIFEVDEWTQPCIAAKVLRFFGVADND